MGLNAITSVRKGQPVVTGRLRERVWSANGQVGRSLQVDADMLGDDLSFGTTEFTRVVRTERSPVVRDRMDDQMAYLLAGQAADEPGDQVTDVTGLTVLEDPDELDSDDLDSDYDPDPGSEAEELVAAMSGPTVR
jgi:hypothetical protein